MSNAREVIAKMLAATRHAEDVTGHGRTFNEDADMVITALAAAGLAIVPVEPTEAMMAPVHKLKMLNSKEIFLCGEDVRNCGIWKAMLRAAQETGT